MDRFEAMRTLVAVVDGGGKEIAKFTIQPQHPTHGFSQFDLLPRVEIGPGSSKHTLRHCGNPQRGDSARAQAQHVSQSFGRLIPNERGKLIPPM